MLKGPKFSSCNLAYTHCPHTKLPCKRPCHAILEDVARHTCIFGSHGPAPGRMAQHRDLNIHMGSSLKWVALSTCEHQGDLPVPHPTWGVRRICAGALLANRLSLAALQVDSKATLGLGGVAVVLGAVIAAMGFYSYLRVPSSLVIIQVVPFLVLAVGADNIFIFVLEYQVRKEGFFIPSGNTTPSLDKAPHRIAVILADSSYSGLYV